jgi:low affinity Fe/Cu permease
MSSGKLFGRIAKQISRFAGGAWCFGLATASIVIWAATGPIYKYSDDWQLVLNTGTSIVTFLMVFLIQNSQNRDTEAIQIKLDELIRVTKGAHNALLDLEELEPHELAKFRASYTALAGKAKDPSDSSISASGIHHVELDGIPQTDSEATDAAQSVAGNRNRQFSERHAT